MSHSHCNSHSANIDIPDIPSSLPPYELPQRALLFYLTHFPSSHDILSESLNRTRYPYLYSYLSYSGDTGCVMVRQENSKQYTNNK